MTAKTVRVVPTRGVAEGFASLLAYDPEADGDDNADGDGRGGRRTSWPARSPGRCATPPATSGPIREGDWLGIARDGIRRRRRRPRRALRPRCSTSSSTDEHEIVTIIEGEGAVAGDHPPHRGVARRSTAPTVDGRGPPRRPAAVPVPLRHRVARRPMARRASRQLAELPVTELEGRRARPRPAALGQARRRDGARPAHPLPAPLPRPHQRGPHRRPRGRARRPRSLVDGACAPTSRRTRNGRSMVTADVTDGTGAPPGHVLQPAVARAAAARRAPRSIAVRQARALPGPPADDEPGGRPDRRPDRAHRARLPAVGEGRAS